MKNDEKDLVHRNIFSKHYNNCVNSH